MKISPKKRIVKSTGAIQTGVKKLSEPPPTYCEGLLEMPAPHKPVKGSGFERLRWRMSGLLQNHDTPQGTLKKIPSGLQHWFYETLPERHKTKQGWEFWITPEAWRQFIDYIDFWKEQWAVVEPQRAEAIAKERAAKKKKRETQSAKKKVAIQSALAPVAVKAGLKTYELKAKLSRLKDIKQAGESALFAEMILAADPWLLEAVLAGATVYGDGDWKYGHFFSSNSHAGSDESESNPLFFWLAVSLAKKKGCCPSAIRAADISRLYLTVHNEQQIALVTKNILPALEGVCDLHLDIGSCAFSTAGLPLMPRMASLSIRMHDRDFLPKSTDNPESVLKVQDIERQIALESLTVYGGGSLEVDDDQLNAFGKVRLEAQFVSQMNNSALKVLLSMHADYSARERLPVWWNPLRLSPDVTARVSGRLEDFEYPQGTDADTYVMILVDASGQRHEHEIPSCHGRRINLGDWVSPGDTLAEQSSRFLEISASLSAEQIALIAESRVPVRLHVDKLTEEFRELSRLPSEHLQLCIGAYNLSRGEGRFLSNFKGEIRIDGECDEEVLEPLMEARGALWLEGKQFKGFKPGIARHLACFKGGKLGLVCWENLSPVFLRQLASFPGELHLVRPDGPALTNESLMGIEHARILASRTAPVRLGPRFGLSAAAIDELQKKPEIGLGHYQRILKLKEKKLVMAQTYDPQNGYTLRKILTAPNTPSRSTDKKSRKEILAAELGQLMDKGWQEMSPEV